MSILASLAEKATWCMPSFVEACSTRAALLFVVLATICMSFILSSSNITFDDKNLDGDIDINELKFDMIKPTKNVKTWWKYAIGAISGILALHVPLAVYHYQNVKKEITQTDADDL